MRGGEVVPASWWPVRRGRARAPAPSGFPRAARGRPCAPGARQEGAVGVRRSRGLRARLRADGLPDMRRRAAGAVRVQKKARLSPALVWAGEWRRCCRRWAIDNGCSHSRGPCRVRREAHLEASRTEQVAVAHVHLSGRLLGSITHQQQIDVARPGILEKHRPRVLEMEEVEEINGGGGHARAPRT